MPDSTKRDLGENVKASVKGETLTLEIDLSAQGRPSASGKTVVIASTRGNQVLDGVSVGVNVYKKPQA